MTTTTENRLQQIWDGCLRNERKNMELLYKIIGPKMMAVCQRYANDKDEAQDIMQEGFIKLFKNMHNYRREGSLEGWIRRIMVHAAISRYRKAKSTVLVDDFNENTYQLNRSANDHRLEADDLLRMIQTLPDTYRSVFNMYAIEGYSHQEIGNALGMSELLSRTTLHRARAVLKEKIRKMAIAEQHYMAC